MKKILLSAIFVSLVNCGNNNSILDSNSYFDPNNLSKLSLDNVGNFWNNDTINDVSDFVTASFALDPNHLKSIRYAGVKGNYLEVSVFISEQFALDAMNEKIPNVSALIFPGNSSGEDYDKMRDQYWSKDTAQRIEEKWWWGIYIFGNIQRYFTIAKNNTIISACNYNDDLSDSARLHIENAVIEVANRVDRFSE